MASPRSVPTVPPHSSLGVAGAVGRCPVCEMRLTRSLWGEPRAASVTRLGTAAGWGSTGAASRLRLLSRRAEDRGTPLALPPVTQLLVPWRVSGASRSARSHAVYDPPVSGGSLSTLQGGTGRDARTRRTLSWAKVRVFGGSSTPTPRLKQAARRAAAQGCSTGETAKSSQLSRPMSGLVHWGAKG